MKRVLYLFLIAALLTGCARTERKPSPVPESTMAASTEQPSEPQETESSVEYPDPQDMVFVAVSDYLPEVMVDLKYAGTDNFTGQVVYEFSTVYLRYGTVQKLAAVQEDLQQLGLGLKIWDGFRPVSAQYRLWEICPDTRYVANPNTGFSAHSRGNTVDLTLIDSEGREVEMPSAFDDFSKKADRDYSDCTKEAADNALILEVLMEKHGFSGYENEWWHFTDTVTYPVEETFVPTT